MGRLLSNPKVNSKMCPVCQSADRFQIEQLVLSMSPSNPSLTLDAIADAYDIDSQALRVHALMHTPLALDFSDESEASLVENFKQKAGVTSPQQVEAAGAASRQSDSPDASALIEGKKDRLVDQINMRESDMLMASANEMLTTLSVLGRRIKRFASDNSDEGSDQRLVNFCTNSMVNLYMGTASELRKTIDAISDLNVTVNGAHDKTMDGIKALADAIKGSDDE